MWKYLGIVKFHCDTCSTPNCGTGKRIRETLTGRIDPNYSMVSCNYPGAGQQDDLKSIIDTDVVNVLYTSEKYSRNTIGQSLNCILEYIVRIEKYPMNTRSNTITVVAYR